MKSKAGLGKIFKDDMDQNQTMSQEKLQRKNDNAN